MHLSSTSDELMVLRQSEEGAMQELQLSSKGEDGSGNKLRCLACSAAMHRLSKSFRCIGERCSLRQEAELLAEQGLSGAIGSMR